MEAVMSNHRDPGPETVRDLSPAGTDRRRRKRRNFATAILMILGFAAGMVLGVSLKRSSVHRPSVRAAAERLVPDARSPKPRPVLSL